MNERPILFSGAMVRAILDGAKTQTRRVMKPQPAAQLYRIADSNEFAPPDPRDTDAPDWRRVVRCPYGAVGDKLWVRETHALVPATAYRGSAVPHQVNPSDPSEWAIYRHGWDRSRPAARWRPSIHMPRWSSRITLEIADVRVERVQDISEEDAIAEGVPPWDYDPNGTVPCIGFAALWDSINAARGHGWAENPWVWVVSFRRVTP